ncbi:MAG: biotin--[acetyl-CoA-carboxylase] ligase [Desulfohalobiaceae bacterium]|nr:biotin--[acetyl-CoA-carboxylase] ligase [Desulfohalobiaceae bacterium]
MKSKLTLHDTQGMLLDLLKTRSVVSGQALAARAGISRTAVWKMINRLRDEGYSIDSAPGQGYCLQSIPDRLLSREVQSGLQTRLLGRRIVYLPEIESTQTKARELAGNGEPEGCLVIAEKQTQGRGRLQRAWADLPGSIFLTLILRPTTPPQHAAQFPLLAGVALARAVQICLPDLQPQLKWPNDLQLKDKKCAGILAELAAEPERIHYLLLGLGLNVNCPARQLPPDIQDIATSLQMETGESVSRTALVRVLLQELEALYFLYQEQGFEPIRAQWKTWTNTLNKPVRIHRMRQDLEGTALDIDEHGALILQEADGAVRTVSAGDVSLREAP